MIKCRSIFRAFLLLTAGISVSLSTSAQWNQSSLSGPNGSVAFGAQVVVLSNGNYFVSDPAFDPGSGIGTGAVFLIEGSTNKILSQVVGSRAGDKVGSGGLWEIGNDRIIISSPEWNGNAGAATWMDNVAGIYLTVDSRNSMVGKHPGSFVSSLGVLRLFNRNYVVLSPSWTDGSWSDLGAVTWGPNGQSTAGYVSNQNSLVGTTAGDRVGGNGVTILRNGNYVVRSPNWQNSGAPSAGAATWGDGAAGTSGDVSAANSLVGTTAGDRVGSVVLALSNSNYVVATTQWTNGAATRAGAVTWCDGTVPTAGTIDAKNSIVGTSANDQVGLRVFSLSGGNYVVLSPFWDDPASGYSNVGAATWGKGNGAVSGPVASHNSMIGSNSNDRVGSGSIIMLSNGNYVFASPFWNKETGAVTWGDAGGGNSHGYVSPKNSLVGSNSKDRVGSGGVVTIAGGGYVAVSPEWDDYPWAADVGAVTWGDPVNGSTGKVDASNSLIGSTTGDRIGSRGVIMLTTGNYVVLSPNWSWNGIPQVGAATFVQGGGQVSDVVSTSNSIHGDKQGDRVANGGAVRLDQHYAISSQFWRSGGVDSQGIGAVTWGDGVQGTSGAVSSGNSITGSAPGDRIGMGEASTSPLATGNGGIPTLLFDRSIVVASPFWGSGGVNSDGVGAVTWFDAYAPTTGVVDHSNSLVGNQRGDRVGSCGPSCGAVEALQGGQYCVYSSSWDDGSTVDAGAVTLALPRGGTVGHIDARNSVIGQVPGGGPNGGVLVPYPWLTSTGHLLVGVPFESRVATIGP